MGLKEKVGELTDTSIVMFLSNGCSVKEIANEFNVNLRTLEARLIRVRDKCNAFNNTHLVAKYLRNKLIK